MPPLEAIDQRIETSHTGWTSWVESLSYDGSYPALVRRSALSLKFLWYSPTGALAAAATTSLPEGIGGEKNYDYRYAWCGTPALLSKPLSISARWKIVRRPSPGCRRPSSVTASGCAPAIP